MLRFVVDRIVRLVLVLIAITVVSFAFMHAIPGDPVALRLGEHASPQEVAHLRSSLGFDRPVWMQLALYLGAVAHGDLGQSVFDSQPVVQKLAQYFPATLELALSAMLFAILVGIPAGVIAAVRHRSAIDALTMSAAILGVSIPVFLLAAVLLYLFAFKLSWFPNTGYVTLSSNPAQWAYHLFLPWVSIAVLSIGFYSRVLRSNLLDMVNEDFVRTARAKGLTQRQVFTRHVLRNSLMPIVTMFGLDFAVLLGGAALVTETVFNLPGIGQYEAQAIGNLDVPPILVGAMFTAFFVVLFSAISDIVYALLDPRIRLTG